MRREAAEEAKIERRQKVVEYFNRGDKYCNGNIETVENGKTKGGG